MAYIELYQTIRQHPKTLRFCNDLEVSRAEGVGSLVLLWLWCLDYATDGDLSDLSSAEIAQAAEWGGDPEAFVQALIGRDRRPRFLERKGERLCIHDWHDYAGKLIAIRQANAERMRKKRQELRGGKDVQETCDARAAHVPRKQSKAKHSIADQNKAEQSEAMRAPARELPPAASPPGGDFVSVLIAEGYTQNEIETEYRRVQSRPDPPLSVTDWAKYLRPALQERRQMRADNGAPPETINQRAIREALEKKGRTR